MRRVGERELFLKNRLLHQRRAASTVLLRPRDPRPSPFEECALPALQLIDRLRFEDVLLQPGAELVAEGLFVGREIEVHQFAPLDGGWPMADGGWPLLPS